MPNPPTNAAALDWDSLLNGRPHKLVQGEDFGQYDPFREELDRQIQARNSDVTVSVEWIGRHPTNGGDVRAVTITPTTTSKPARRAQKKETSK